MSSVPTCAAARDGFRCGTPPEALHRWWAALAGVVGFAVGTIPFDMLLPEAYALNCAIAVATIAYVLVTHLPQRPRPAD